MSANGQRKIYCILFVLLSLDGVYAFCETMPDPEEADGQLEAFGRWMDLTQGIECRDFSYSSLIESLSSTDANGPTAIQGGMCQADFFIYSTILLRFTFVYRSPGILLAMFTDRSVPNHRFYYVASESN